MAEGEKVNYLASDQSVEEEVEHSIPLETAPELAMINLVITEIENGRQEKILKLLLQLPIGAIDRKHGDALLAMLLMQAWKYNQADVVMTILDAWQKIYPREEKIPFHVQLSLIPSIDVEVLSFVYLHGMRKAGVTYMGIMSELMSNHEYDVAVACDRVTKSFGSVKHETLLVLREMAEAEENARLLNYLNEMIRKKSSYQDIPSWVLDFRRDPRGETVDDEQLPTYEETLYLPPDRKITLPPDSVLMDIYRSGKINGNLSDAKFANTLTKMTDDKKTEIFAPILERETYQDRQNDTVLFRLYGPATLSMQPSLDELKYGGQRMFISIIDPEIDSTEEAVVGEWFTGSCDHCTKRIRRRWHAVRIPVPSGGWRGCYCGWNCVREQLETPVAYDGPPDADVLTAVLVDRIERDMERYGIQDRRDSGDIVPLDIYDTITEPTFIN